MSPNGSTHERLGRIERRALALGLAALALCLIGAAFDPGQFFRSYLVGYLFWCGIAIGCLGIAMVHHLVGGGWGFVIQRPLESAGRTFPVLAALFLPLLLGLGVLYPWARPDVVAADELLQHKSAYLNSGFFVLRAAIYFTVWIVIGRWLSRWSLEQDRTGDSSWGRRLRLLSGPGLLVYVLTVTFSSIDWMMSLEPKWYSAIYGMMFVVGHGLLALAFIIVAVAYRLEDGGPLARVASPGRLHDLGNLLLAFVMLWAYMAFSQFLIVWSENLVEEIPWYLHRTAGGWGAVAILLIVFRIAVPFLLLLSRTTKRRAGALGAVATAILAAGFVDLFWILAPAFYPRGLQVHWMDLAALIGVGGIWLALFVRYLKDVSPLPMGDPRLVELMAAHQEGRATAGGKLATNAGQAPEARHG